MGKKKRVSRVEEQTESVTHIWKSVFILHKVYPLIL